MTPGLSATPRTDAGAFIATPVAQAPLPDCFESRQGEVIPPPPPSDVGREGGEQTLMPPPLTRYRRALLPPQFR